MPRLKLDDRSFEDDDGTWTTIEFSYCHPWEVGGAPNIMVSVKAFERKECGGFDFANPDRHQSFSLGGMEITMLHGFLGAAKELMPRQWAEYLAQQAEEKAKPPLPSQMNARD
jgi:hypothetical protein